MNKRTFILGLAIGIPLFLGTITIAGAQLRTFVVPQGGTGASSFSASSILVGNGTGAITATSSPTVGYITATSTTNTSTFAGKIGIGTTSPYAKLSVVGETVSSYFTATTTTATSTFAGGLAVDTSTLFVDPYENMVGIGTTSPSSALEVVANNTPMITVASTTRSIKIGVVGPATNYFPGVWLNQSAPSITNYAFLGDSTSGGASIFNTPSATNMDFRVGNTNYLRLASTGNVGIGTTSPSVTLSVHSGSVGLPDGAVGTPALLFNNKSTLGIFNGSSANNNIMKFTAGGGSMFEMQNTNITEFFMNATTTTGQVNFSHAQNGTRRFTTYVSGISPAHFYSIYHYGINKDVFRIPGAESAFMFGTTTQKAVFTLDGGGTGYGHSVSTPLMNLYGYPGLTAPLLNVYSGTGGNVLTLDSSGNLGIGTSTPYSKLHISSGANATTTMTIGEIGLTTSKACVNMNRADGGAGSFYLDASGALVSEPNYCR